MMTHVLTELKQRSTPASPGGHHPNRPKAGHALTFKLDQSVGAGHNNVTISQIVDENRDAVSSWLISKTESA
jgi:hypothetical protein